MAKLCATLANMAVTDECSPLSGQRVEELEFQDGMIRSRTGNVGGCADGCAGARSG